MARKPTDKQLFKMKNEWLGQFYEEVKPKDFYRAVFPEGSFEREGHPEDEKCNGVLTVIEGEKARNYIVFDELNMVDEVEGAEFAIMSPVGYSGRNRTAKNARWLYGIAVDLDGVEMEHEFERNARTAEAEQYKRAASRVKPTEPDRAGKQSAQRSVGDVERELRGIDEAVKSRTSKGRAEQAERRRAEQEAHQRAEAERRAAEEQQRIASRRYIGRGWELER